MAIKHRHPQAGTVHQGDHGSQYLARIVKEELGKAKIRQSMGTPGSSADNAVAESFFATLKKELIYRHHYSQVEQLHTAIVRWIECWYNPKRRHSTLGHLSPAHYEEVMANHPQPMSA